MAAQQASQHRHSGWTVTAQVTDQIVNTNAGQTVVGAYVYFITGDGNEGSVFIPDTHYNAATVKAAVEAKAALLDEVGRLGVGISAGF